MSHASKQRRAEKRAAEGKTLTDEERRAQLREDPLVQGLIGEAVRNMMAQAAPYLRERDAFVRSLAILLANFRGGRVVITAQQMAESKGWKLQTLFDEGAVVHYVVRDAADEAAAALREKAAASGLVLPG